MLQVFQTNASKEFFDRFPQEHIPEIYGPSMSDLLIPKKYIGRYCLTAYTHSDIPLGVSYIKTRTNEDAIKYLNMYKEKIQNNYKWQSEEVYFTILSQEFWG